MVYAYKCTQYKHYNSLFSALVMSGRKNIFEPEFRNKSNE